MKHIILSLSILMFGLQLSAQNEQADAIFKNITHTYTLHADGSIDYTQSKELKLLTHRSFNRMYGETFIIYNPDYQELKINESYTIMDNGIRVVTPSNAFNKVLPRYAAKSAAHNQLIEMVVTHTGLEVGASIFLDYTLHTKKGSLPYLMEEVLLPQGSPCEQVDVIVNVPKGVTLNHKTLQIRTAPEINTQGAITSYHWKFNGLDAMPDEGFQLASRSFFPRILFSTAKDMYSTTSWFMKNPNFSYQLNDAIKTTIDNYCKDAESELKKMRQLQKLVVNDINLSRVPLVDMAYNFRNPNDVWQSNTATEFEKALLLTAIYNHFDINARVVGLVPNRLYDSKIGLLQHMVSYLVQVNPKDEAQYYLRVDRLNKTNEKYMLAPYTIVELNRDAESLRAYTIKQEVAGIEVKGSISLDNDHKISGEADVKLTAALNPCFDYVKNMKKAVGILPTLKADSILDSSSNEYKTNISLLFDHAKGPKKQEDVFFWPVPETANGIGHWGFNRLHKDRTTALQLRSPVKESYEYQMDIPEGYYVLNNEVEIEEKSEVGDVKISIRKKKNSLHITRSIMIHKQLIPETEYQDFRTLMNLWNLSLYKEVLLKKNN